MSAAVPRPCASENEYRRFLHHDLDDASPVRLRVEHYEAVRALARILRSGRDPVYVFDGGRTVSASEWWHERMRRTERAR